MCINKIYISSKILDKINKNWYVKWSFNFIINFRAIYIGDDLPMVVSSYLSIISRVLLSSDKIFTQTVEVVAKRHNKTEQSALASMLDVWLIKMRNVSQMETRKLLSLALAYLLTTQSRPVLERLNLLLLNILETLNDITKVEDNGAKIDSLVMTAHCQSTSDYQEDGDNYETDHDQRRKQLGMSDPVHTIILKDYLQSQVILYLFCLKR